MTASRNRHPRRLAVPLLAALLLSGIAPAQKAAAFNEGYLDVTIQDGYGDPLSGASVVLYPYGVPLPDPVGDPDWQPATLASAGTGPDGVAHFVLDFDSPTLQVSVHAEAIGFFSDWYQRAANYGSSNPVSISPGVTATTTMALFQKLRVVRVNTYDAATFDDLAGATVELYAATGDGTTPALTATTDANGSVTWRIATGQLDADYYRVRATRAGYLPQWYVDSGDPNDFEHAIDLDLTMESGSVSVDIAMTAGASVPFTTAPKPTISGKPVKGKTLTAKTGTWVPNPAKFTYRWYRGTKPISGATSKTYTLRKADVGKRIKVKVKASLAGYVTTTRTSSKTAVIKP
jgi:hypothetical protein